jgi:prephenate dehydratase
MASSPIAGIQGIAGSFHEMAAMQYFHNKVEILECDSFKKEFDALNAAQCDYIVVAIENTLAGSILPNYALLEKSDFFVVGEVYLEVNHCLMSLPGQKLEEMTAVWSHPMALLQCDEFLADYPNMAHVEKRDTASSAKEISETKVLQTSAIGPVAAANRYGLEIYAENIQTHKLNFTRFLIIGPKREIKETADKASVVLQFEDKPGALQHVLETFTAYQINLTKIQSIPIIGKPYSYSFHFDLEWKPGTDWQKALAEAGEKLIYLKLLGVYEKGNRPDLQ